MSEVKIVRLSTGEELLCTVKDETTRLVLTDVAILIPTQQNQLGLSPFMAYSNAPKGMTVERSFVMFIVDPIADLLSQYQKMFSKVITANGNNKIII